VARGPFRVVRLGSNGPAAIQFGGAGGRLFGAGRTEPRATQPFRSGQNGDYGLHPEVAESVCSWMNEAYRLGSRGIAPPKKSSRRT
jgi:hypothetical protein